MKPSRPTQRERVTVIYRHIHVIIIAHVIMYRTNSTCTCTVLYITFIVESCTYAHTQTHAVYYIEGNISD